MMWKLVLRRPIVAACLASSIAGGCVEPAPARTRGAQEGGSPACDRWRFKPDKEWSELVKLAAVPLRECKSDQCGLNGMWFGQGLAFREIRLGGEPRAGFKLREVIPPPDFDRGDQVLRLGIERDELLIVNLAGEILIRGEDLVGAKIMVESTTERVPLPGTPYDEPLVFELEIQTVTLRDYWDCVPGAPDCEQGFRYEFHASTNADGGCEVELCDPDLALSLPGHEPSVRGNAVVFGGDVYDDASFKIRSADARPGCPKDHLQPDDEDVINFTCVGTALSKLHLMRHTPGAARAGRPTTVSQRQAMLRMITADYCGIGRSFTENGTRLQFEARGWPGFEGYGLGAGATLEAVWTEHGASCVRTPRHVPLWEIDFFCKLPPPRCPDVPPSTSLLSAPSPPEMGCSDVSGDYMVSANPQP